MGFEQSITGLNEHHYYAEFVFADNRCRIAGGQEIELGDNIIALGDLLMVFELKERAWPCVPTEMSEERWYRNKILNKAIRQVRATAERIRQSEELVLANGRDQKRHILVSPDTRIHQFVVYLPHPLLSQGLRRCKAHVSAKSGVIHTLHADDYANIVDYLVTPAEVAEYFSYREHLIGHWGVKLDALSEPALLGHYIAGASCDIPSEDNCEVLRRLGRDRSRWDMSQIFRLIHERTQYSGGDDDSHHILTEMAQMMRHELLMFKTRFNLCIDAASANRFELPYRFALPRTGCAYVFVPLTMDLEPLRLQAVLNLTCANMYSLKMEKGIGVSIVARSDGGWNIEWCHVAQQWQHNPAMEAALRDRNPFRDVHQEVVARYSLSDG